MWSSTIWISTGDEPKVIYQSHSAVVLVGWSETGKELIVGLEPEQANLRVLEPAMNLVRLYPSTNSVRTLARIESLYPLNMRPSPNRTSIAFATHQDGADNIWIVRAAGGRPRRVTQNTDPRLFISGLEWSPDGHTLYYSKQSNRSTLWLVEHF